MEECIEEVESWLTAMFHTMARVVHRWPLPNHGDRIGGTPLHLAAFNDRAEVVRVLLDSGADVKVTGFWTCWVWKEVGYW